MDYHVVPTWPVAGLNINFVQEPSAGKGPHELLLALSYVINNGAPPSVKPFGLIAF
jgi:hypothetical protein